MIKLRNVAECIVGGVVVVAGVIAVLLQDPEDGHVRDLKLMTQRLHRGDLLRFHPSDQYLMGIGGHVVVLL